MESNRRGLLLLLGTNENAQKAAVAAGGLISRSWNVTGSNANHLSQANFSPWKASTLVAAQRSAQGLVGATDLRICVCVCVCVCACMPVCVGFIDSLGCHSSRYHSDSHWSGTPQVGQAGRRAQRSTRLPLLLLPSLDTHGSITRGYA